MSNLWPQRILLPLDGSALDSSKLDMTTLEPPIRESSDVANQAISIAICIARNTGAKVDLLEVMYIPSAAGEVIYIPLAAGTDQGEFAFEQEDHVIKNEIEYVTGKLKENGVIPPNRVPVSEDILGYAKKNQDDLIVLYGHSFTGYDALLSEKEAQEIEEDSLQQKYRLQTILVLHGENPTPGQPLRALVTLDPKDSTNNSSLVDKYLEPARQLVAALSAPARGTLKLFAVVDEDQAPDEAVHRLEDLANSLNSRAEVSHPVQINSSVVTSSDVPKAIVEAAQSGEGTAMSGGFDLIAMATHGQGGLQRIFHGSVTKDVLDKPQKPILIVHHP